LTNYAPDDLLPVLESIKIALKSIDVRTVAVLPPSEEDWQNLITSIIVSDKTVEKVKAEHKQLPNIRNNEFVFFYQALPFDYEIFGKISDGEFRVLTPYGYNKIKTRAFDPLGMQVNSSQEWIDGVLGYLLRAGDLGDEEPRKKLWEIVRNQEHLAKRHSFSSIQKMMSYILKIEYGYGIRKDFEVLIPPLVKIENVQFSKNKINVTIQRPSELEHLQLNVVLKRNFNPLLRNNYIITGTNNSIELEIIGMLPFDVIYMELIQIDSGLTLDRMDKKVPLTNLAEPFAKTLDAFCALDKLKKMLFEPEKYGKDPAIIFENAVTWLLSLAGFETIHLGIRIKRLNNKQESFDTLQHNGYNIGSADIIAYEENERLLLIDCDINSVDPKKVEKLAELKKHFRDTLQGYEKFPIVPILFTPRDFRGTPPSIDVMIADRAVITNIFEDMANGNRERARSNLHYSGL
jgi:hypothetical protein